MVQERIRIENYDLDNRTAVVNDESWKIVQIREGLSYIVHPNFEELTRKRVFSEDSPKKNPEDYLALRILGIDQEERVVCVPIRSYRSLGSLKLGLQTQTRRYENKARLLRFRAKQG